MHGANLEDGQRDAPPGPGEVVFDELLPESAVGESGDVGGPHYPVPQLAGIDPDWRRHMGVLAHIDLHGLSHRVAHHVVSRPPSTGSATPEM
jgi:hypothetical protein